MEDINTTPSKQEGSLRDAEGGRRRPRLTMGNIDKVWIDGRDVLPTSPPEKRQNSSIDWNPDHQSVEQCERNALGSEGTRLHPAQTFLSPVVASENTVWILTRFLRRPQENHVCWNPLVL